MDQKAQLEAFTTSLSPKFWPAEPGPEQRRLALADELALPGVSRDEAEQMCLTIGAFYQPFKGEWGWFHLNYQGRRQEDGSLVTEVIKDRCCTHLRGGLTSECTRPACIASKS
jgi:hypothetical protein